MYDKSPGDETQAQNLNKKQKEKKKDEKGVESESSWVHRKEARYLFHRNPILVILPPRVPVYAQSEI